MKRKFLFILLAVCLCAFYLPTEIATAIGGLSSTDEQSLKNFLVRIGNNGMSTYDYQDATANYPDQRFGNLFEAVVTHPVVSYCDFSIYPIEQPEIHWRENDPLGMWSSDYCSYGKYSVKSVKWVLTNIFNCSEQDFNTLEKKYTSNGNRIYKWNDYYYVQIAGVGIAPWVNIKNIKSYDNKYQIDYDFGAYTSTPTRYRAIMDLKNINGRRYWSLYLNQSAPTVDNFQDVFENDYYADAIHWAVENGIANGVSSDSFNPDGDCQRGHIVTFLWRFKGSPMPQSMETPFIDLQPGAFYGSYYHLAALWAQENGIANGVSSDIFGGRSSCTRAQAVTFLWRMNGKPAVGKTTPFTDVPQGSYYEEAIKWAVDEGITSGTSPTTFSPNASCTRAQIVTFLYRNATNQY